MADKFLFSDEAGDFAFKKGGRASRYFINCSVVLTDCTVGNDLLALRRELNRQGHLSNTVLHAVADPWPIRRRVYEVLQAHDFRVDATLLEKSKAQPQTREDIPTFYRYAWYYHLKYLAPRIFRKDDHIQITAAALDTNKSKAAFKEVINNSAQQLLPRDCWGVLFMNAAEDPCLWVADYCAWAIQRKWELGDRSAYDLIADKVYSEYDLWQVGKTHYY